MSSFVMGSNHFEPLQPMPWNSWGIRPHELPSFIRGLLERERAWRRSTGCKCRWRACSKDRTSFTSQRDCVAMAGGVGRGFESAAWGVYVVLGWRGVDVGARLIEAGLWRRWADILRMEITELKRVLGTSGRGWGLSKLEGITENPTYRAPFICGGGLELTCQTGIRFKRGRYEQDKFIWRIIMTESLLIVLRIELW